MTPTAIDLEGLRALLERATPGPWRYDRTTISAYVWPERGSWICNLVIPADCWHSENIEDNPGSHDARLIVAAVNALPALLAELAALRSAAQPVAEQYRVRTHKESCDGWLPMPSGIDRDKIVNRPSLYETRSLYALPPVALAGSPDRVRHLKRGSTYAVEHRGAEVQTGRPIVEGDKVTVYVAEADGTPWVRLDEEFNDGRFEPAVDKPPMVTKEWFERKVALEEGHEVGAGVAAVERAPHGDAGGGADPNCPDCLGEGRNIVSFDPPASYPCACTFTEGEMKEMAGRRALDGEKR